MKYLFKELFCKEGHCPSAIEALMRAYLYLGIIVCFVVGGIYLTLGH